jgi:hypothetical protein
MLQTRDLGYGEVKGIYVTHGLANMRILLLLLRSVMGILLLADVSFQPTYHAVEQFPILRSGLSALNVSLVNTDLFNLTSTAEFWWYFPSILSDSQRTIGVPPVSCSGDTCHSYFLPGSMAAILLDPNLPAITPATYPDAVAYIQNDAPGYQLDYYPVDVDAPGITLDDCRVYGLDNLALQICLKNGESSLVAGMHPF